MRRYVTIICLILSAAGAFAAGADTLSVDTVERKEPFIRRMLAKLLEPPKPNNKPFEMSFVGAPAYSPSTSLMIAFSSIASYRWSQRDTLIQKSNATLYASASINGMLSVGIMGENFAPEDKQRFSYDLNFLRKSLYYWGNGYENGINDANKTPYQRIQFFFKPEYLYMLGGDVFLGIRLDIDYNKIYGEGHDVDFSSKYMFAFGAGFTLAYDKRDNTTYPTKGVYLRLNHMFYPTLLGNTDYPFNSSDVSAATYLRLSDRTILAGELHGWFNYGNHIPWIKLAQVGTLNRMRGYYEGRYRDNNLIEGQIELRHRLKGRSGVAVFAGAANIFGQFKTIQMRHTLHNFGLGYRFEMQKNSNVRIDLGFTNDSPNLVFSINEAF